jgi:hypothetical protein
MKAIELIKKELGDAKLPPNANTIFTIIENIGKIRFNMEKLLVKLSYENIGNIILGDINLNDYVRINHELSKKLTREYDSLRSEMNKVEVNYDEYEVFYDVIDNNFYPITEEEISDMIDSIVSVFSDIIEGGGDKVLRDANQSTIINEFNRYKR